MANDETMTNVRMTKISIFHFELGISSFLRALSFVIRHFFDRLGRIGDCVNFHA